MRWLVLAILGVVAAAFAMALSEDEKAAEQSAWVKHEMASLDDSASKAWHYRTSKDEMRGVTLYTAEIAAEGYAVDAPQLIVQRTGKRYDIAIRSSLKSGATEFPGCIPGRRWHVNIKFDGGGIREVPCTLGMDSLLPASLLPSLKASKKLMIEMHAGGYPVQYTFRTSRLTI